MHAWRPMRPLARAFQLAMVALTAAVALLPAVAGAAPSHVNDVVLNGAGATFPAPLYTRWFSDYYNLTGQRVQINYQAIGSGGGIAQVTARTVDFGASDAILNPTQQAAAGDVLMIPMTSGSVAVVYNVESLGSGMWLNQEALAGIFLGQITKWNDPKLTAINPSLNLPDQDITVVHRSDGSGTSNIFTDYLSKISPTWQSMVGKGTSVNWPAGVGGQGNAGVAGQVKQIPGAIGYVEFAYAVSNNLSYASLQNASGSYVAPSLEATTAAAEGVTIPDDTRIMLTNSSNPKAYPIVGFTWLLIYSSYSYWVKGKELVDFLHWAIHDGQQTTWQLQYAPLSPEVVEKAEGLINQIRY